MVVDDESRMRKLVKDFLVKQGYSVIEAANGEEAVDRFVEDKDIQSIASIFFFFSLKKKKQLLSLWTTVNPGIKTFKS